MAGFAWEEEMNIIRLMKDENPSDLGIVSGVPIPKFKKRSKLRQQMEACRPGDSFLTTVGRSTVYYFAKQLGIKAAVRELEGERRRVWRV